LFLCILKPVIAQKDFPCDSKATAETVNLYHNLKKLLAVGIMIGHQDDMAYGVNWKYEKGRSDIKDVTGDYPAVFGWELGHIELDSKVNLDSVPFDKMQQFIQEEYEMGAVITISWHLNNPLTGKSAWEPAKGTVAAVLPGGEKNELYKSWLDKVAVFLNRLKGKKGEFIPVIFRPFHELNGSWFWWGKNHCTADELKQLYRFTADYLKNEKQIHHLLFAYNTDRFATREEYLERYPGDEYVDIVGFDIYQRNEGNQKFIEELNKTLTTLESIAAEKKKIPALTEFGYGMVPDSVWWTKTLWQGLKQHKISYALAWRNAGKKNGGEVEFYMPYKGHASAKDFYKFYQIKETLFSKDLKHKNIYKSAGL
jgi:hypothetical protein